MIIEIGDEVVGVDSSHAATFGRVCKVTDCRWSEGGEVRRHVVDLIVYDPDTKMWEDYDTTLVNVPALALKVESPYSDHEKLDDAMGGVLNSQDPFAAVEVLMFRHWLQDRVYAGGDSVAECQFISCEELIRQAAECLVRLSSAALAPYQEEVLVSKKHNRTHDPDAGTMGCAGKGLEGDKPKEAPAPPAPVKKEEPPPSRFHLSPLLPEAYKGKTEAWKKGWVERLELGEARKKPDVVADYIARNDPMGVNGYSEGWNKAENFIRSGGK